MKRLWPAVLVSAACTGVIGEPSNPVVDLSNPVDPTNPVTPVCDAACQAAAHPTNCLSSREYFEQYAWPQVFSVCVSCHVAGGQADGTRFMLKATSLPNHYDQNFAAVNAASTL